jgi:arginyl-tRNA synthetase
MAQLIRDDIAALVTEGIRSAQAAGDLPMFDVPVIPVERPKVAAHGDYSTGVSMGLARLAKMKPIEIAQRIVAHLPASNLVGRIEAVPPGYINFALADAWLAGQVETILAQGEPWGSVDMGRGSRVQVEFVSANPTGPLTVGSARNAAIGDTLASVLQAAGYAVEREYYMNDAGSKIRKFGQTIYARYAQAINYNEPLPEEYYPGQYLIDLGRQLAAEHGDKFLSQMPRAQAVDELTQIGIQSMLDDVRDTLKRMNVHIDTWFSERSLYASGLFDRVLKMLQDKGLTSEKDGAVWFAAQELGEDKDAVLIRSADVIPEQEDRPTYLASDVAYVWNKLVDRKFDKAIYIWGADHQGDKPRVIAAARALGLDPSKVVIVLYQLVTLKRGGELVRMSKSSGEFITLREVIDEVGSDAIRFTLLTRSADSTMDFDLKLAKEQSSENPVYYVQYAHARIASILKKARSEGFGEAGGDVSLLVTSGDLSLIRKMLELREVIAKCAADLSPHHLAHYAQDLAATFHAFYRDCRVVSSLPEDAEMTQARLKLVRAAKTVLARTLHLMGMNAPDSM